MPEIVACPQCAKTLRVPDHLLGQMVKCPSCGNAFRANADGAGQAPPRGAAADEPPQRRSDKEAFAEKPRQARDDRGAEDVTDRPRRSYDDDDEDTDDRPRRSYDDDDEDDREQDRRRRRRGRRRAAAEAVSGPAIALIAIGIIGLVIGVLNVVVVITGFGVDPQMRNQPGVMPGRMIGASVSLIWGIVVLVGGVKMKSLTSRGSVMTAAIIAMIPCNLCCLAGLPVGIWALVAMSKPEVKEAFG